MTGTEKVIAWPSKHLTEIDADIMIKDVLSLWYPKVLAKHLLALFNKLPTDFIVAYAYEQGRKDALRAKLRSEWDAYVAKEQRERDALRAKQQPEREGREKKSGGSGE